VKGCKVLLDRNFPVIKKKKKKGGTSSIPVIKKKKKKGTSSNKYVESRYIFK
jgi:hypothetical protein